MSARVCVQLPLSGAQSQLRSIALEIMPNITVTVDDSVYTNARIAAAIYKTTVTQLVRTFLQDFSQQAAQALDSGRYDSLERFNKAALTMDLGPEIPYLTPNKTPKHHV